MLHKMIVFIICLLGGTSLYAHNVTIKNETSGTMYVRVNFGSDVFCSPENFHVDAGASKKLDVGGCCTGRIECRLKKDDKNPVCEGKPNTPAFGLKCGSVTMTITKDSSGKYSIKD